MSTQPEPAPENPLYAAWLELVERCPDPHWPRYDYKADRRYYEGGGRERGESYPGDRMRRHDLVAEFSWAVPTPGALARIAALSPIVEVGAGTGYWASLLGQLGADVLAFDLMPPSPDGSLRENPWHKQAAQHFPVRYGGAPIAGRHPERTLMLCWPPYGDGMALRALRAYEAAGGQQVVYIGEGYGGCCADDRFFHRLGDDRWAADEDDPPDPAEVPWRETASIDLPQWPGLHDRGTIYERRPS